MKRYEGSISKESLNLFVTDIGSGEFFSYVGSFVSLEQAISVLGLLSPDFIECDGCLTLSNTSRKNSLRRDWSRLKLVRWNKVHHVGTLNDTGIFFQ